MNAKIGIQQTKPRGSVALGMVGGALASLAVMTVCFVARRASPWAGEIPWIPGCVSIWADRNGNFRNLPAFAGLALLLFWPLGIAGGVRLAVALAVGLETAQVSIASRSFDWADIAWSLAGVALAFIPAWSWKRWGSPKRACTPTLST